MALEQQGKAKGKRHKNSHCHHNVDKTENLLTALKKQIDNLKRKIEELEAQKRRLEQELAREIERERARAARASAGRRE